MLLIFPPQAPIFTPHLALPQLAGYLNANGYRANIVDLNILFYDYLLRDFANEYRNQTVASAIDTLWDKNKFYMINEYEEACRYILWALEIQKKKCGFRNRLLGAEYSIKECSSDDIMRNIEKYDVELFPIFKMFLDNVLSRNKLVGISVGYESQLIPAISLCRYIKKKYQGITIVLGGSHITSIYSELKNSCLNIYFDHLISGPGEEGLLSLVRILEEPAIRYDSGCQIEYSKSLDKNEKKLYAEWSDMKGYRYLAPELVIPLCVSEGCYWGKCSFCNHESLHGEKYRIATIENAINYIDNVCKQTDARYFTFVDSVIPIAWLESLADRLGDRNIIWDACVRFDEGKYDFAKLYKGGCRLLRFGLESGAQSVLNMMNKGISLKVAERILKDCFNAGICTFVFFFTGFPGETKENAYETIEFIKNNAQYINFANGGGTFYLGKGSPIHKDPESFNVTILSNEQNDISLDLPYVNNGGMSKEEIYEMATFQRLEVQKLYNSSYGMISQVYDTHDLLYAAHYGTKGLKYKLFGENV